MSKDLNRELFIIDNQLREAQDDHTLDMSKVLKDAIKFLRKAIDRELNGD